MSIWQGVPERTRDFVTGQAARIIRCSSDGIGSVLRNITSCFSEKEYGWHEAILSGKWYRYPDEVIRMRFCSEEALKNFLLCRAMGIPAKYYIVDNYGGSGMSHESVFVENGDTGYLLDWRLYEAKIGKRIFACKDGPNISFSKLTELSENDVVERVSEMRNADRLLDSLSCGQLVWGKHCSQGLFDAYTRFRPGSRKIEFLYYYTPYGSRLTFYLEVLIDRNGEPMMQEAGIVKVKNRMSNKRIPLIRIEDYGQPELLYKHGKKLEEYQFIRLLLYTHVLQDQKLQKDQCKTRLWARKRCLALMREFAADDQWPTQDYWIEELDAYEELVRDYPAGANIMLDNEALRLALGHRDIASRYSDLRAFLKEHTGIKHVWGAIRGYTAMNLRDLGRIMRSEDLIDVQKILCREIGKKIGSKKLEFRPAKIFRIIDEGADMDFWDTPEN